MFKEKFALKASALTLVPYIIDRRENAKSFVLNIELHRLLYIIQLEWLVYTNGEEFFAPMQFEATPLGPRETHIKDRIGFGSEVRTDWYGKSSLEQINYLLEKADPSVKKFLDTIIDEYAGAAPYAYTVAYTYENSPWRIARARNWANIPNQLLIAEAKALRVKVLKKQEERMLLEAAIEKFLVANRDNPEAIKSVIELLDSCSEVSQLQQNI